MLTEWEAIQQRISCRAYQDRALEETTLHELRNLVRDLNQCSGLHFQFIVSDRPETPAVRLAPAMFASQVQACAALVGARRRYLPKRWAISGKNWFCTPHG